VSTPRITVGLPVYRGADLLPKALDCLQRQTFGNFEAIISVDGGDEETAVACRPFLSDPRFRMLIHPQRLDWVGNFNWLLQQDLREFFCYRQHDDTTAPEFFETLLQAADSEPNAAAIYSDCRYDNSEYVEVSPSIEGEPLDRVFQYVKRVSAAPLRGLIRLPAIRHAGLVRSNEFRAVWQHCGWLAKLLHCGNFKRVAKPIYYRLSRPDSLGNEYQSRPKIWKQDAWPTMFTTLLDAAIPICRTPEARLFMRRVILDQIVAYPNLQPNDDPKSLHTIVAKCVERVEHEGNSHLLDVQELPAILQGQKRRVEIMLSKRSRVRRAINESRERYQLGKLIYPQSRIKRTAYQISHSANMLRRLTQTFVRQLTG
jgi:glycosyltransferase involved in cell wall biosynthesis